MKKIFAYFLAVVLISACAGCKNNDRSIQEGAREETEDTTADDEVTIVSDDELAQEAYDCIEHAELLCKGGVGAIFAAWHFGIWDAPECSEDTVLDKLSAQIGIDVPYIEENGGYSAEQLIYGEDDLPGWEFCLWTTENCLAAGGTYRVVGDSLDAAKECIKSLSREYISYQDLRDYYTKVAVYAAYFNDITGSYSDLEEAIPQYEDDIKTAKEKLLFDFG